MSMNMADMWEAVADAIPDEIAQIHGDKRCTYRDFDYRRAKQVAERAVAD